MLLAGGRFGGVASLAPCRSLSFLGGSGLDGGRRELECLALRSRAGNQVWEPVRVSQVLIMVKNWAMLRTLLGILL